MCSRKRLGPEGERAREELLAAAAQLHPVQAVGLLPPPQMPFAAPNAAAPVAQFDVASLALARDQQRRLNEGLPAVPYQPPGELPAEVGADNDEDEEDDGSSAPSSGLAAHDIAALGDKVVTLLTLCWPLTEYGRHRSRMRRRDRKPSGRIRTRPRRTTSKAFKVRQPSRPRYDKRHNVVMTVQRPERQAAHGDHPSRCCKAGRDAGRPAGSLQGPHPESAAGRGLSVTTISAHVHSSCCSLQIAKRKAELEVQRLEKELDQDHSLVAKLEAADEKISRLDAAIGEAKAAIGETQAKISASLDAAIGETKAAIGAKIEASQAATHQLLMALMAKMSKTD
jgi:hypothetical protein